MKGVRYAFPAGLIVEFTYPEDSPMPPDEWVQAHKREGKRAIVSEFESPVPVHRTIYPDGTVIDEYAKSGKATQ